MTRPAGEVAQALALHRNGLNATEIAALSGVPRSTVSNWLSGSLPTGARQRSRRCFRCAGSKGAFPRLVDQAYAYLLGLYLGDGCLAHIHRQVFRLDVCLDAAYPVIVAECTTAMTIVMPHSKATARRHGRDNCVVVTSHSKHWPCLFPQHGRGPKHRREIVLAPWQREICDLYPWRFLRGLVHSDGCRSMNTIKHPRKTYVHPRYSFSNRSLDIQALFCEYCDKVGVDWRQMNRWNISVARRDSVALMDLHIGPKR